MFTSPKFRIGDRVYRKNSDCTLYVVKALNPDIVNDSGYYVTMQSENGKIERTFHENLLFSERDAVFAVVGHCAWQDGEETKLYAVTKNFTRAKQKLSEIVEEERKNAEDFHDEWVENEGNTDTYYESYVDGWYSDSHFYAFVKPMELE